MGEQAVETGIVDLATNADHYLCEALTNDRHFDQAGFRPLLPVP
jgi:hypothetical protein